MNASRSELELEVEGPAANLTPKKTEPRPLPVVHGDSQCLPEQCEQPVTATTAGTGAGNSDGDSSSVQSYMPAVGSEPENAATEPEDWNDDLEVAALDEEVNQPFASEGDSNSEIVLAAGSNATNHPAIAPDALRVASMNLSSGGNQNHNIRDGWNLLTQQPQPMHTWVQGRKVAKGMRKVHEERGLWRPGKKLKVDTLQS